VYEQEFDLKKRIVLLQELDSIVSQEHPYILDWSAPYTRIVFWNKFGHPKGVITRIGDYRDPPGLWWFDDKKSNELEAAVKDPSKTLPVEAAEDKYWLEFERVEEKEGVLGEKSKS
jgi:microcin C transport system substrate-binding protein